MSRSLAFSMVVLGKESPTYPDMLTAYRVEGERNADTLTQFSRGYQAPRS